MTTNSIIFRSQYVKDFPQWYQLAPTGDYALSLLLASKGSIAYFDKCMSVYRKGVSNSWTKRTKNRKYQYNWLINTHRMLNGFNRWSNRKYTKHVIIKQLSNFWLVSIYIINETFRKIFK
jgi:hypothetical protein